MGQNLENPDLILNLTQLQHVCEQNKGVPSNLNVSKLLVNLVFNLLKSLIGFKANHAYKEKHDLLKL